MSQELNYKKLCKALRENAEWCDANEWEIPICMGDNQRDAADAIEQLQAENERLKSELEWKDKVIELAQRKQAEAEAERDAAVDQLRDIESCSTCKYGVGIHAQCNECAYDTKWQWRGVKQEDAK